MKKLATYFVLGLGACLISCSSDENNDSPENQNLMTLKRIEKITTSNQGFYVKRLVYYENNRIVADSSFESPTQWFSRTVRTTEGNIKKVTEYTRDGHSRVLSSIGYDPQGRIISRHAEPATNLVNFTYVYNPDNTITAVMYHGLNGQTSDYRKYYVNERGMIYKEILIPENKERFLTFEGDKPILYTFQGVVYPISYYPNPKPANLLKTVTELNNEILAQVDLYSIRYLGNFYYLNNDNPNTTYETTFNALNYLTFERSVSISQNNPNYISTTETNYFYN
ncbi:hypothetical protein D3C87_297290 [compost metagenome]